MKKLLTLFLLLACLPALAQTHVTFTLANFTSTPVTNRNVWITPMSTPTVSGGSVITGDRYITNSGTTGIFTLSNAVVGLYYVQIKAPPSETAFKVLVTATNLGTIQASTILSADSTATFPAGTVAWSAATTDARYAPFGSAGVAVAAGTNTTAVTNGAVVTISSTGGGSGVSVAAGTNSLAVTNGSLVTVSGTGNAVWATNLSKGGVFISPIFTGTTGNNNNAVRIQGSTVLLTLNDTNQTLSLNGIFSGTGSLVTDLNYNYITNPPTFQSATANGTNWGLTGTNTFLNTNDTTNAAYVIANQFSIPSWAEVQVNFQSTWDTNFANSGAAMIRSQNTNYPIYVSSAGGSGVGTNFFVKSGRVFYWTNDLSARYIGFSCSNLPTRFGTAWRVFDQNRGAAVNWPQLVMASSTNVIVTAPGNAGINVAQGIHWVMTPDLGTSTVGLFTSGAGSGDSIGSMPMHAPAANYLSSPLGGRTTTGADTPDKGEVFVMEMVKTPAMGNTIQFHYRNQTYTTNDALVGTLYGKNFMAEIYFPNGSFPVSANYELIAMWAGTKPEDLISGQVTMDLAGGTNLNASELRSGTAPTARLGSGSANSATFLRGDGTWSTPPGGGDVSQGAQNNFTLSNSFAGLTEFNNNAAFDSAHFLSLSNLLPNAVLISTAGKQVSSLAGGGAGTYLQGTTPPTYTSISGLQTPWVANEDAATNRLTNVLTIAASAGSSLGLYSPIEEQSNHRGIMLSSFNVLDPIAAGGQISIVLGGTAPSGNVVAGNNFISSSTTFSQSILGGTDNTITGDGGTTVGAPANSFENTIIGGGHNKIYGTAGDATVVGGQSNYVTGQLSLAAGFRVKNVSTGTFAWGDSEAADFTTYLNDAVFFRAVGGMVLTNGPLTLTNSNGGIVFYKGGFTNTGNIKAGGTLTVTGAQTNNGSLVINGAGTAAGVVNVQLDINNNIVTNVTAIGGGTSPTFNAVQFNSSGGTTNIASAAPVTNLVSVGSVALTDAATVATDASLGTTFRVTLAGNRTLGNPTNAKDGQRLTWEVIQDGTGTRTLAMGNKFAFGTDITGITLTTTASKRDFITAVYNGTADLFYIVGFTRGY